MFGLLFRRRTDPKAALKKALGAYELPCFPASTLRVLEVLRDPSSDARRIATSISQDPGLTTRVLRTVNSTAYAARTRIESVAQAVALMGTAAIESLVLSVAAVRVVPHEDAPGLCARDFWRAAARRAALARALAERLHPATSAETFTVALLQDLALPFLVRSRAEVYPDLLASWRRGAAPLPVLEHEALGWTHAEVAAWVCEAWRLPERIGTALGSHHDPISQGLPCPPAAAIVSVLRDTGEDEGTDRIVTLAEEHYGLTPDEVRALIRDSEAAADELARLLQ